jgi:hypothetical protein
MASFRLLCCSYNVASILFIHTYKASKPEQIDDGRDEKRVDLRAVKEDDRQFQNRRFISRKRVGTDSLKCSSIEKS